MLVDVVEVEALEGCRLSLRFEDGLQGEVDVAALVKLTGVFAPLADQEFFRRVRVERDLGTVCWPNGADIAPEVLYDEVAKRAVTRAAK